MEELTQDFLENMIDYILEGSDINQTNERLEMFLKTVPIKEYNNPLFNLEFREYIGRLCVGEGRDNYESWRQKPGNAVNALHFAADLGRPCMCMVLVQVFKYIVDEPGFEDGMNALHLATRQKNISTVEVLLEVGAKVDSRDRTKATALHSAVIRGYKELVELLLDKGADAESVCIRGTLLQHAALASQACTMQILLRKNINVNSVSATNGRPPLYIAVEQNSIKCVKLLSAAGADLNVTVAGTTPLCRAAASGTVEMVSCLLNAGADPNYTDVYDETPLENTIQAGKSDSAVILHPLTRGFASASFENVVGYLGTLEHVEQRNFRRDLVREAAFRYKPRSSSN